MSIFYFRLDFTKGYFTAHAQFSIPLENLKSVINNKKIACLRFFKAFDKINRHTLIYRFSQS